jgi:N-acetylglutamate synthase-like GNAT family acetyltransferase
MEPGEPNHTPIRNRRARRADFGAVREILAAGGAVPAAPDRAHLRRFRRVVADLGDDFYVAVAGERVVGFVHLSYARQIFRAGRARVETLLVAPEWRERGVASSLLELAMTRARRRGCAEIGWVPPPSSEVRTLLAGLGWQSSEESFRVDLAGG